MITYKSEAYVSLTEKANTMSIVTNFQVITGNVTADPELRFIPSSGAAVVNFTVAHTPRYQDNDGNWTDGETLFQRVSAVGDWAQNIADSVRKGMRVTVTGQLRAKSYAKKDSGDKVTYSEIKADTVGVDLRYASAVVTKIEKGKRTASDEVDTNAEEGTGE